MPSVGMDAAGNFVITWTSANAQDGSGTGIFGQRFYAGGALTAPSSWSIHDRGITQSHADVAMLMDGRFAVVWQSATPMVPERSICSAMPQTAAGSAVKHA